MYNIHICQFPNGVEVVGSIECTLLGCGEPQRTQQEHQRAEQLAAQLRALGIEP